MRIRASGRVLLVNEKILHELILDVYDTALHPEAWPDVLSKLSDVVGARGAFIFELLQTDEQRRILAPYFSESYEPALVRGYLATHNDQEIADQDRFAHYSSLGDGIELIGDHVLASSEEELLARANTRQMLEYGIRYRAGALLDKDHTSIDRFALQFSKRHGPITRTERKFMQALLPHVAKALNINRPTTALVQDCQYVLESLDLLHIGICVVRAPGLIIYRNAEFIRQMEEHDVFWLDPGGRLRLNADKEQSEISAYMRGLFKHGRFGARPWKEAVVVGSAGSDALISIEICPLTAKNDFSNREPNAHLIYSLDASRAHKVNSAAIAQRYSLTAAEEKVLAELAQGKTNMEISDVRGVSVETVNSQVKSILSKTQAPNRAKLIRLATHLSL